MHGLVKRVHQHEDSKTVVLDDGREISGDQLLVAIGRRPVVNALGLDKAGAKVWLAHRRDQLRATDDNVEKIGKSKMGGWNVLARESICV